MIPDLQKTFGAYTAEDAALHLKYIFLFKNTAWVCIYKAACPITGEIPEAIPSSTLVLHTEFLQPCSHQGQSSAIPSRKSITKEMLPETKRVCWCHTTRKGQEARSKGIAAQVPEPGSHQHSGDFLELGWDIPALRSWLQPPPPSQASCLLQVSTCPSFPFHSMQIPHRSFTFSLLK